jgi:hypothetical protein
VKSVADVFHRVHGKARPLLGTVVYGVAASLAAVAFQVAINWLYYFCFEKPAVAGAHFLWIIWARSSYRH